MGDLRKLVEDKEDLEIKLNDLKHEVEQDMQDEQEKMQTKLGEMLKQVGEKGKSDLEAAVKARDESQNELKLALEKKMRGLAKKLRGEFDEGDNKIKVEMDENINKIKQEINLI